MHGLFDVTKKYFIFFEICVRRAVVCRVFRELMGLGLRGKNRISSFALIINGRCV